MYYVRFVNRIQERDLEGKEKELRRVRLPPPDGGRHGDGPYSKGRKEGRNKMILSSPPVIKARIVRKAFRRPPIFP